jgi:tetratricopeptide (TPR) repeat protein
MTAVRAFVVAAALQLGAASVAFGAAAQAAPTDDDAGATAAVAAVTAPAGMTDAELEAKLAPLASPDAAARRAAVTALSALGPDAEAAVVRKLASFRKIDDTALYDPVRAGRASDPGGDDLAQSLASYGHVDHASGLRALTVAALLGAAAHIATTPAIREMAAWVGPASNVYRPDITRRVKLLGDHAVPALIMARKDPNQDVRRWAFGELESLGKRVPGDAVQTKDNQILADTLQAYGETRDADSIAVILSFVNSDRIQVRNAARTALAAFGQDAIWKLREAYTNLLGKSAPDGWSADQIAKELFAAYDRFRLEDVYALLEQGTGAQKNGKNEDAVAAFDKVLARQPMLDRRAEMVPAYFALGMAVHETDRPRARALLRKAERLDPGGTRAPQIEAELTVLEGQDLLARGIADEDLFQRALKLDPGNAEARTQLDRLAADSEVRQERTHRWAAGGALLFVALAGIILFGGRGRGKKKPLTTG